MDDNKGHYKYSFPKKHRKILYVSINTHEAVTYFAEKKGITVQEATQHLLSKTLREEFNLDQ